jgi:putative oxidoreductase
MRHIQLPEKTKETLFTIFRIIAGLMFMVHGLQKFGLIGSISKGGPAGFAAAMGLPSFMGYAVAIGEVAVGLAIALGLLTKIFAIIGAIIMLFAIGMAHLPKGLLPNTNGGELATLYLVVFLALFAYGPGKYALDSKLCEANHKS